MPNTEHEHLISVPPDGGWGWIIVFISCYAMVIIDVPALGFQVIEGELMGLLKLTAAEVSIFFSIYTSCMFLMGPVAGGICNRFGFRLTNIIGCSLMIIGLGSSYFMSGYLGFLLLYGLTAGCGTSFILMVANVATGFWFEKKRAIAMGLVSASGGISIFTVAMSSYFADQYGWKFCFCIWGGLVVVLLLASFLLLPPPMVELETTTALVGPSKTADLSRVTNIIPLEYDRVKVQQRTNKKLEVMAKSAGVPLGRVSRPSVYPSPQPVGCARIFRCCYCCHQSIGSRPLYRKDIFYEGSVYYVAMKDNKDGATLPLTMSKLPTSRDVQQELECHCMMPEAVTRTVREMLDWSLLTSPIFLLILIASIIIYAVRYIPFMVLKKFNSPYMDNTQTDQVMSMMGLGSMTARASVGFLLYFFHDVSALAATIFVSVGGGAALCCLTLSNLFTYQMVMAFVTGALTSVVITLRSLVIIDLLGLNRLTSCTGILFFLQGFASFVAMPTAAILNEMTGSHRVGLLFSGSGYILAGIFNIILLLVSLRKKKV